MNWDRLSDLLFAQGRLIDFTIQVREQIEAGGDENCIELINTVQFFAVNSFDILIIIKNIFLNDKKVEQNLFARVLATICFQVAEEGRSLTGHKFRDSIKSLSKEHPGAIEELGKAHKIFVSFYKTNSGFLNEIRNNSLAHRNKNISKQIEFIEKIDVDKIVQLGFDLFIAITIFNKYFERFFELFGTGIREKMASIDQ